MKVLVVVHQFLPKHAAGSELYTYYLARELRRRGNDVRLYFTEIDHDRPAAELTRGELDGLPFYQAIQNHVFPDLRSTYVDLAMEANLRRVLADFRPDVVHVQHLYLHGLGYLDHFEELGIPVVYTLHEYMLLCLRHGLFLRDGDELCPGPEPEECARCSWRLDVRGEVRGIEPTAEGRRLREVRLRADAVRRALSKVDLFVAPSRFLRDRFVEQGGVDPARIVHSDYGFDVAGHAAARRVPSDVLRVGFLGTLGPWKGAHLLVDAFNGLPEAGVEGRIWGRLDFLPDYVRSMRERRRHLGLRFMGELDNAGVPGVLAETDVLVVPSIWYENSPLTIHEAFLAGVPVVCSDRGGMAELVRDGVDGLHFRLGDAGDLRAKLLRLLQEPELLEELRSNVPAVKDVRDDARETEERYRALVAARTGSIDRETGAV